MLINNVLSGFQSVLKPLYESSYVLQKLDLLILLSVMSVVILSGFANSDLIGYAAMLSIVLMVVKLLTKPKTHIRMTAGDIWLLLYFMIVLVSVAGSTLFLLSFKGFIKTITYLGFYGAVVSCIKDNREYIKYILLTLGAVVFAESLTAINQNFLSVEEISGWQDMSHLNPEQVMTRVYGALKPYNPNLFGGYMLSALPATILFAWVQLRAKHFKTAFVCGLIFLLSIAAVIMTGCRGAYVGLFFEILFLTVVIYKFLKPYYRKIFGFISSVFAVLCVFVVMSVSSLKARIFSIFAMRSDSSNSFRFNVYNSSLDMFRDNWLLGIGVGNANFREVYGLYMKTGFDALSAYNIYLETAVESGVFALAAFLGFILMNLYQALRYIFTKNDTNVIYLVIAVTSLIGVLIHGFVDTVYFRPQIQFVFWIMMGIIRVLTCSEDNREL